MYKKILLLGMMLFSVLWSMAQNNVGIGIANPAAKLDVRGNGINYDVFNASNDKNSTLDSTMLLDSRGNLGLGTATIGNYRIMAEGRPSAFSPQIEVWNGNPSSGGLMLGDINDVGGLNGSLNLYLAGITKNVQLRAQGVSYFTGGSVAVGITTPAALFDVAGQGLGTDVFWAGNDKDITPDSAMILSNIGFLGLGTKFPQERLHLNGALVVGQMASPAPVAGTISFNGTNFFGFDGSSSKLLDVQQDGDWGIFNGVGGGPVLYTIFPGPAAVAIPGYVPAVALNQYAHLFVSNIGPPPPGILGHQILMEDASGTLDASQGFLISNLQGSGQNLYYSQGLYNADLSFKICNSPVLAATTQSDNVTLARFNQNGIADFPNQSRVRAYQEDQAGGLIFQLIPPSTWTPVNYNIDQPLPYGYDERTEFTVAPAVNAAVPPEQAYFTATQAGYYQVNARCEFKTDYYTEDEIGEWIPVQVLADSYVSIAIYAGAGPGQTSPYAEGNKLQIAYAYMYQTTQYILLPGPPYYEFLFTTVEEIATLKNNNAPNVSDVVYLQAGEIISIWVYHTAATPMNLVQGKNKLYVTIHKVS